MSIASLCNTTADVYRLSVTQNEIGAVSNTPVVNISSLACRIRLLKATEQRPFGEAEAGVIATHRMYCAVVDILEGDEVRTDTTVYTVQFINNVAGMGHHLEVELSERRPDRHGRP